MVKIKMFVATSLRDPSHLRSPLISRDLQQDSSHASIPINVHSSSPLCWLLDRQSNIASTG